MCEAIEHSLFVDHIDTSRINGSDIESGESLTQFDPAYIDKFLKSGNINQLKDLVRCQNWPLKHSIRRKLWVDLCRYNGDEKHISGYYEITLKELLGDKLIPNTLPTFCDPVYNSTYCLNEKGRQALDRVLYVVAYTHPSITYCPLLYPLAALFLHYLSESETFSCLCDLLTAKKEEFMTQTKSAHEARAFVAKKLARKYAKQGYLSLQESKTRYVSESTTIDLMQKSFERWLCWIFRGLPLHYLIRVLDCFLLEGSKVMYRTLISILISFSKPPVVNGTGNSKSNEKTQFAGLSEEVVNFCQTSLGPLDKFLKTLFGIRGLSRKEICKRIVQAEMLIKSRSVVQSRRVSMGTVPSTDSLYQLYMTSGPLAIRESKHKLGEHTRARSLGMIPLKDFQSSLLTPDEMSIVWSWIPARITMLQPHLVYSTNEHGSSLTAFFMRVDPWEPTILVVKDLNDEVFGAYCSTTWALRNTQDESGGLRRYFGTGESFVFTLAPQACKYQWVGVDAKQSVSHSQELFMAADKQWICIGSGNGQALWLDESLAHGKTEHCDTFNNSPLCAEKHFQCKVIEVIAFQ